MHSSFRGAVNSVARKFGYQVSRYPVETSLDYHLMELIRKLDISVVVDVGAHHGEYALRLRRLGFTGSIVSYEPSPEAFAVLAERANPDPNWSVVQKAASNRDGEAKLVIYGQSQLNSLFEASDYGSANWGEDMGRRGSLSVETCRLQPMIRELKKAHNRVLLKVDTQGNDLTVLEGTDSELHSVHALQVEVPVQSIYAGVSDFLETVGRLTDLGFDITGMFPIMRDPRDGLRVVEFDCILCNRRLIV